MPVRTLPAWPAARPLRSWQEEAIAAVRAHPRRPFLASATPAAGKTTFGLHIAHRMLRAASRASASPPRPPTSPASGPPTPPATASTSSRTGPNSDGPEPRDRHGVAVTYQTLAAGPTSTGAAARSAPTLLIADEPHHMGDQAAWGRSAQAAFDGARFRLLLSGTPFRSDNSAIPWITYDDDGISRADYAYGYPRRCSTASAARSPSSPTTATWSGCPTAAGAAPTSRLGLPAAEAARRLRTALDPEGDWMGEVLRDADARLTDLRAGPHPDAGGLVWPSTWSTPPARGAARADLRRAARDRHERDRRRADADRALRRRLGAGWSRC